MDIRPIKTDTDHQAALREIDRLWDAPEGSADADKLDVLATLVEVYEAKRWPITGKSTPKDVIQYAITEMGRSQKELGEVLGSPPMASEMLNGKRRVSLDAAQKISAAWNIPIQLLVAAYGHSTQKATSRRGPTRKAA